MGTPRGAAARGYVKSGRAAFWIFLSVLVAVLSLFGARDAQAQTCAFGFSVPYKSPLYTYIMSETENYDVLMACDTRYPAVDSGLTPNIQPLGANTVGSSTWLGTYKARTNIADNTVTYTPAPNFSGSDTFTLTFCNQAGCGGALRTATVTVTVGGPTLSMTPAAGALPGGTEASAYSSGTITASGGTGPYTFSITSGALPAGIAFGTVSSPDGTTSTVQLTGTPTASGTFNFTVEAADSSVGNATADGKFRVSRAYSITIAPLTPVANAVSATVAYNSAANPITLNITGGTATSVAVATNGTHGAAVASGTSITYTPTVGYAGPDSFTYTATNTSGTSSPATVTITVSPPTITLAPTSLPSTKTGLVFSQTVTASGGAAPYTYAVTSGSLPAGLDIDENTGAITGTPTGTGPYSFTVTAIDSSTGPAAPFPGSQVYSGTVVTPTPPIANAVSATVAYGSSSNPITLNITGGVPISVAVGTQATNGTATASGTTITYTPTAGYFGPDSFTYTATNADGTSAPATVTMTVHPQPPLAGPTGVTVSFNSSNNNVPLNLSGGTATSVAVASAASNGTATASGTSITYTPTTGYHGSDSFTYTATNAGGTSAAATVSIVVNPAAPVANDVAATVAANSTSNVVTLNITGGPPASVAVTSGPSHGSTSIAGTTISYTPTAGYSGADSFTYTATNVTGTSAAATVSITVTAPTLALSAITTTGTATTSYSSSITATLGTAPYVFEVTSAAPLPDGLTLDENTGAITGIPVVVDAFTFTVTASDAYGATGSQAYTITIGAPTITITAPAAGALTAATTGTLYSQGFTAAGGNGSHTFAFAVGSTAPPGMTLSAAGVLSGTPNAAGSYSFAIIPSDTTATGEGPFAGTPANYTLQVSDPVVTVTAPTAGPLAAATTGTAYSQSFTASGGNGAHKFSFGSGTLPPGLTLSTAGVLSGTPNVAGSYSFDIAAVDSTPIGDGGPFESAAVTYSIEVTDPTVTVTGPTAGPLTAATTGTSYSETFTASGGNGVHTFALASGDVLPPGLTLSASGGLSGTPNAAGTYNFSVVATDSTPAGDGGPFESAAVAYSLEVTDPTVTITGPTAGALPAAATTGVAYSETFTASGGNGTHTFSVDSGSLPPGLTLSPAGVLSGTPNDAGSYSFDIVATDSTPAGDGGPFESAAVSYSLMVSDPTVTVTSPAPGGTFDAYSSTAFSRSFAASGGQTPHKFALGGGLAEWSNAHRGGRPIGHHHRGGNVQLHRHGDGRDTVAGWRPVLEWRGELYACCP